ncbi:hypothetical protein [Nonomuraea sp. NPDC050310]|uniref:SCO6745 family protein n=1 Tax=Nonomuraea sp. NPDC050310 TaxID=3154935 RepID=UPI0033D7C6F4
MTLARKTWRTLEPYHGMIYFSPEAEAAYRDLGLSGRMGYFASRSAAMGAVSAEVVVATFANFNPELVRQAIPAAWGIAGPEQLLAARLGAVDATLRRVLGEAVASAEMARAATLARQAAEAIGDDSVARPLYAAHAALPWADAPHLVLWQAQTLLREYRGDAHLAALLTAGLNGIESLVTHAAAGGPPAEVLRLSRGWTAQRWAEALDGLRARGLLSPAASGSEPHLTPEGARVRQEIEDLTDRRSARPYEALGEDACTELRGLVRPWSKLLATEVIGRAFG